MVVRSIEKKSKLLCMTCICLLFLKIPASQVVSREIDPKTHTQLIESFIDEIGE